MKEFIVPNHHSSFLPEDHEWTLAWSDEFDGTELDRSKWDFRRSMMGVHWPAWTDHGVSLDGESNAVFTLIKGEDGRPVSSQLQTGYNFMDEPVQKTDFGSWKIQWPIGKLKESLYTHGPGYYECRCRLQQKPGWWSAFWIQSPIIGASLDPKESGVEIDIMESFAPGNINGHNVFACGYGLDLNRKKVGGAELDQPVFSSSGLPWDETGYTFYIDGVEDGKVTDFVTAHPEFILISTEVKGYRYEDRQPVPEAYEAIGDTFVVDYIRIFNKVEKK